LKDQVTHPIEARLGRKRSEDKYAPRTIDIDIIIFDGQSCNDKFWSLAYVVIPLAEIYSEFQNPLTHEAISETAKRLQEKIWLKRRSDVLQDC
jgi:7,8-dihydro-6-hydroxymethylpterin-pyrophosphokinase